MHNAISLLKKIQCDPSITHFYKNQGIYTKWRECTPFVHFIISISLQPNVEDLRYFKLWIPLYQIIKVWNNNHLVV